MSKHRSIDDDFWKDPKLRKESLILRTLLMGLITEAADDEGRFEVEPYGWLDAYFARHDPVTEDDLAQAWARICELGICCEYDEGRHGFLCAWFRRQLVQNHRPSTLPVPPPMDGVVTSRAMMGAVYDLYLKQHVQKGKSWMTVAAHWWASLEPMDRLLLAGGTAEELTDTQQLAEVTYCKLQNGLGRDGTGRDGKGPDNPTHQHPSPKPAAPAAPVALPVELTLQSPPEPKHQQPPDEPPAEPPVTVTLTPTQEAIERLWAAFGFTFPMGNETKLSKSGKPSTEGYSGLVKIVDAKGLPIVGEYTAWVNRTRPPLPAGSNRWVWFLDQFRGAMSRPWEWRNGQRPQMGPRPVGDWSAPDATRAPRQD